MHYEDTTRQCVEIIRATNDGNLLSPQDLYFIQCVCNLGITNDADYQRLTELHRLATTGSYTPQWYFDYPNLTQDHNGFILWRGKPIEHHSFPPSRRDAERHAAARLFAACTLLESHNEPVSYTTIARILDAHEPHVNK